MNTSRGAAVPSPVADDLLRDDEKRRWLERRYALLASAVVGKRVPVCVASTDVVFADGTTLFIPSIEDNSLAVGVVVQAALLAVGSLRAPIVTRLTGRQAASRRYLTLEANRAFHSLSGSMPRHIACLVARHWSGEPPSSCRESLDRALSTEDVPQAPDLFGIIYPWKVRTRDTSRAASPSSKDAHPDAVDPGVPDVDEADGPSERSRILELISTPFSWENPLMKLLGMGRKPRLDSSGAEEMSVRSISMLIGKRTLASRAMVTPAGLTGQAVAGCRGGTWYPEWDEHRSRYRSEWCRVEELDPPPGFQARLAVGADAALRRQIARLGLVPERHKGQEEGECLDLERLVDLAVAKASGISVADRFYEAALKTGRDLSVLVLLDASGSTAERNSDGPSIWDEQRRLTASLVAILEQVGDRVAAYGFRSRGRQHVEFLRLKEFEARFDEHARRRLAALEPSGFTRMGSAIRHAHHVLATRAATAHRLLVVVSDGLPYDDGYEAKYAESDTRVALAESARQGIGCVCLSLGGSVDDEDLRRLWGTATYARMRDPSELRRHALPLMRSALAAVQFGDGKGTR